MSLNSARAEVLTRFKELRAHLEVIKSLEIDDPLQGDPTEALVLRGLFYVHLYSILEFTINQAVQSSINSIRDCGPQFTEVTDRFLGIALDPEFMSLSGSTKKNWEKRRVLLDKLSSPQSCSLNDGVFYYDLQNIWYETLEMVFNCFGMVGAPVPDDSYRKYWDEIVEKRNSVAHGRETASRIGRGTRSPDLEIRLDAITRTCDHLLDRFELYLANYEFVKISARRAIKSRTVVALG